MSKPSPCFQVVFPEEVEACCVGQNVRLVGCLSEFDLNTLEMCITFNGHTVRVNATLLGPVPISRGSIWTIIGTVIQAENGDFVVEALSGSFSKELHLGLLKRALSIRREHIQSRLPKVIPKTGTC
eukprot:m.130388 g.130388  ORF g.130388 m.130388 type:complete len:126 (+) comp15721_c0_seq1:588-965(+)